MNFPRKALLTLLTISIASAAFVATATPAHAHTPSVSADCAQLSVTLDSYRSGGRHGGDPNQVTISIDGTTVVTQRFGRSFAQTLPFANSAAAHPWSVVVDAVDNEFDRTFTGTSVPCVPVIVMDAAAAVTLTQASCSAPATLTLGAISNATWSRPTATRGPADYTVTATANPGHAFDDAAPTRVFSGTLAGQNDSGKPPCAAPPPVLPPAQPPLQPQAMIVMTTEDAVDCEAREVVTTTTVTTTGTELDSTGLNWIPSAPVVKIFTTTRAIEPGECPAAVVPVALPSAPVSPAALARTGVDDPAPLLWLAAIFAAAGAALVLRRRVRPTP